MGLRKRIVKTTCCNMDDAAENLDDATQTNDHDAHKNADENVVTLVE